MQDQFDEDAIPYFNFDVYDLLYMGYGDSVPTTGFLGASMTYEKGGESPIQQRTDEQHLATWTSMYALATDKTGDPAGPGRELPAGLPRGRPRGARAQRGLRPGQHPRAPGARRDRPPLLHRGDPRQGRRSALAGPAAAADGRRRPPPHQAAPVPGYKRYGEPRATRTLPKGTYWVPMAQAQKHWIQAMLGEDSYVPFPYFYDVTAWSGPLLFNVPAGRTGAKLRPKSAHGAHPGRAGRAAGTPHGGRGLADRRRHLGVRVRGLAALAARREVAGALPQPDHPRRPENALAPLDVLLVPNGDAETAYEELGPAGRRGAAHLARRRRHARHLARRHPAGRADGAHHRRARRADLRRARVADPGERRADPAGARRRLERLELLRVRLRDVHRRRRERGRAASPTRPPRAGSSPASRTARRSSAAPPRSWTSRTPTAASSRSPASRTSAPSPTGPRRSCGTRCTAPTRAAARSR